MAIFDYRSVLLRIQDEAPLIDIDASHGRLRRLIEDAVKKVKRPEEYPIKHFAIDVEGHNGVIEIPCDMLRPLRQFLNENLLDGINEWRISGNKVFPRQSKGVWRLSYYAVEFIQDQELGDLYPINDWEVDYCAYTAICTMLQGELNTPEKQALYQIIEKKKRGALASINASMRNTSISKIESAVDMLKYGDKLRQ